MRGALLGPQYSSDEVRACLEAEGVPFATLEETEIATRGARLIAEGRVVGWFQGRMEYGPRALGARSILADARRTEMRDLLNEKIKLRESFRPFAPSVLSERAREYFDLQAESPYMLLTAPVRQDKRTAANDHGRHGLAKLDVARSVIPAVTHVDYSARVQTVRRETHPRFHALLREYERLTGCPAVINTSFNVRGEPIVCAPRDALHCFLRTDMDFLVIDRYLLDQREMPPEKRLAARQERFAPD
jgi:carbamoyltransferase